jgi:hypothetical protein
LDKPFDPVKNPSPTLERLGNPLVIEEFMTQEQAKHHSIIYIQCASDEDIFFHCLVSQDTQSTECPSSKKIVVFNLARNVTSKKFQINDFKVYELPADFDESGILNGQMIGISF